MSDANLRSVWQVRDGKVERTAIRTGPEHEGQTDVLSGLTAGDIVVACPVEGLKDGARVNSPATVDEQRFAGEACAPAVDQASSASIE